MTRAVAVDIVLCVHNGARFIAEQEVGSIGV